MRLGKLRGHCDIPKASGELLVVHLWLVLSDTPSPGNLVRVTHLELPAVTGPVDKVLAALVCEELKKKLKRKIMHCKLEFDYSINLRNF